MLHWPGCTFWTCRRWRSYILTCVRTYVRTFVMPFSQKRLIRIFWFLHEDAKSSNLKSDSARFSGKNLICPFWAKKGDFWPKNGLLGRKIGFFSILSKCVIQIFWFFAWKCKTIELKKWRSPIFWEKSYSPVLGQKGGFLAQNWAFGLYFTREND